MKPAIEKVIRVAVVEDQAIARDTLAEIIHQQPGMELVGAYSAADTAFSQLPSKTPDVVVMDYHLPGFSGAECVRRLHPIMAGCQFLMLTIVEEQALVFEALKAGASGYVVKGVSGERVCEAIRDLAAGGSPMSATIARKVVTMFRTQPLQPQVQEMLSAREEEVLTLLARGRRYKVISTELGISDHTVRSHIHHIYKKLHVRNKNEAIFSFRRR